MTFCSDPESSPNALRVSVIVPAHNSSTFLQRCLESLFAGTEMPREVIVVDDHSSDEIQSVVSKFPVQVLRMNERKGPAFARNLGSKSATGDVLLFLDSDVCVQPDTIEKIRESFEADSQLDALIGSYDNSPHCPEFLSQYRNLLHAYVHQTGAERASTFWSGCGAIRRELFLEHCGFDEGFGRPAVEDIELGYRLNRAGRRILLDRDLQVNHLKRWTFWNLVKTDVFDRGIPWTELILRDRYMPNDLNLHLSQRVSVALVFLLVAISCVTALYWNAYFLVPLFTIIFVLLARWWIEFATPTTPRNASILLVSVVSAIAALAWWQGMVGILPPLLLSPVLLLIRHCYALNGPRRWWTRAFAVVYISCSICTAVLYLPSHPVIFASFGLLAAVGLLNSQFYVFLAANRGVPFMLAAIPFHLLYHFYNGVSFLLGTIRYAWGSQTGKCRHRAAMSQRVRGEGARVS